MGNSQRKKWNKLFQIQFAGCTIYQSCVTVTHQALEKEMIEMPMMNPMDDQHIDKQLEQSEEENEVRCTHPLSLQTFSKHLVQHFHIMFKQAWIYWPGSHNDNEDFCIRTSKNNNSQPKNTNSSLHF